MFKWQLQLIIVLTLYTHLLSALEIYSTGSPKDFKTSTKQLICLAGGGPDEDWIAGWRNLLSSTNGGDVVIIRADDQRGGYEEWIYDQINAGVFPKVNSVSTLVIANEQDANSFEVVKKIMRAELIFFAGGDQSLYIDWFKNSKLLKAVEYQMNVKKVSIAGTSAGMAFLGGIDYRAYYSSPRDNESNVNSEDVLNDPTGEFVDLENNVLIPPYMKNILTDTHFSQREREGRLVGFMAKAIYNQYEGVDYSHIKAIAADEGTAFCYDQNGNGKVYGANSVFFLSGNKPFERLEKNHSLNWYGLKEAISVTEIKANDKTIQFDLKNWKAFDGLFQYWYVDGTNEDAPIFQKYFPTFN